MSTTLYFTFALSKEPKNVYYAVDTARVSRSILAYLKTMFHHSLSPEGLTDIKEAPKSFYELLDCYINHTMANRVVSRLSIISLLINEQLPYTPTELNALLDSLKQQHKKIGYKVLYPSQLLFSDQIFKLAHKVTEAYRTFNLDSTITVSDIYSNSSVVITEADTFMLRVINDHLYHFHSEATKGLQSLTREQHSPLYYYNYIDAKLRELANGTVAYHLYLAAEMMDTLPSKYTKGFGLTIIAQEISRNPAYYIQAFNSGNFNAIGEGLTKFIESYSKA